MPVQRGSYTCVLSDDIYFVSLAAAHPHPKRSGVIIHSMHIWQKRRDCEAKQVKNAVQHTKKM
jgi:hypothetical protein